MTSVVCPDCGGADVRDRGELGAVRSATIAGRPVTVSGGRMYRCNQCALAFRHPRLPPEEYVGAYADLSVEYWSAHPFNPFWSEAERMLFAGGSEPKTILDVGCYTGDFLQWLGGRHPELRRFGVEPAREAAEIAGRNGIEIIGSDIAALAENSAKYDAIVLFDVFEHLPNIGECLDRMRDMLADGGALLICTGNYDSWTWRVMGPDYYYTAIPEHVVFASPKWCRRFGERHGMRLANVARVSSIAQRRREFARQGVLNLFYGLSHRFQRSGLAALNALPLLRKAILWPSSPTWPAARDHLLAEFRK